MNIQSTLNAVQELDLTEEDAIEITMALWDDEAEARVNEINFDSSYGYLIINAEEIDYILYDRIAEQYTGVSYSVLTSQEGYLRSVELMQVRHEFELIKSNGYGLEFAVDGVTHTINTDGSQYYFFKR